MAIFTITSPGGAQAPAVVGNYNIYLANKVDKALTSAMFTTITNPVYSNSDQSLATHIKILSLPGTSGVLLFNAIPVVLNQEISIADINLGLLLYDAPNQDNLANNSFSFTVKTATQNYAVDTGTFNITSGRSIAPTNHPPVVGDLDIVIPYNTNHIFSLADFTTNTSPPYNDVEGDPLQKIKIIDLSVEGTILLAGIPIVIGQEIFAVDIPNLVYNSNPAILTQYDNLLTFQAMDTGSGIYSNQGGIRITVAAIVRNAPTVGNNSAILTSNVYTYLSGSFVTNFTDADGDTPYEVIIKSLPVIGELRYLGTVISAEQKFTPANSSGLKFHLPLNYAVYAGVIYEFTKNVNLIVSEKEALGYKLTENINGKMTFTNQDNVADVVVVQGISKNNSLMSFDFKVTDSSPFNLESNLATFSMSATGDINVVAIYQNSPPVVGDNNITVEYNEIRILTQAYFIEDTDPRFFDAEGDQPHELKVLSLPLHGQLLFNNIAVTVNQIISFVDINASKFKYVADSSRTDIENTKFSFAVSDSGSKIFVT